MAGLPEDLRPEFLVAAYAAGYFPMDDGVDDDGPVRWYEPDLRAVVPLDPPRIPRSVQRALRRAPFRVSTGAAFVDVVRRCARPRSDDDGVWISQRFVEAYAALAELGLATSFEAWQGDDLVAGLYGVAIGRAFMAESMFHVAPDAGNVVLASSLLGLQAAGFTLYDVQFVSEHLGRFGAVEVPVAEYRRRLERATRG